MMDGNAMTKQKFYEECVERTFMSANYDPDSPFFDDLKKVGYESGMSFSEILVKLDLAGCKTRFPKKEDFKKWGVDYLCQLLGFVRREGDYEFTKKFFVFLETHKSLVKTAEDRESFGEFCYSMFIETVVGKDRDFCQELSLYMIKNFMGAKWFGDFMKISYSLGLLNCEAIDEYHRIVHGETLTDRIHDILITRENDIEYEDE